MSLYVKSTPVFSPSIEPTGQCKNLKIRSRLSKYRPTPLPRVLWIFFVGRRPVGSEWILHTFEKGKSVFDPATCDLCRMVSACFESTGENHVSLSRYYVCAGKEDGKQLFSVILSIGATQLLPLGIDAHLLGKNRAGFARSSEPSCTNRKQIRQWLNKCELERKACKLEDEHRARDVVRQPKWLINTSTMCMEQSNTTYRRYLALSYVWGLVECKTLSTYDPKKHVTARVSAAGNQGWSGSHHCSRRHSIMSGA